MHFWSGMQDQSFSVRVLDLAWTSLAQGKPSAHSKKFSLIGASDQLARNHRLGNPKKDPGTQDCA